MLDNSLKLRQVNLSDYQELEALNREIEKSPHRQSFHLQPLTGLLNDPNGFSFFHGKWQLFYQWFPFGPIHGNKAWYRTESEDLVHFTNKGLAIAPDSFEDNRGAYSGSAMELDGKLNIYYTGNNKVDEIRHPYQILCKFDGEKYSKKEVLVKEHPTYTEHQRDPKIIYNNGQYYMILGGQTKDLKGCILVYKSARPDGDFEFLGQLKVKGYEDFGYMWECPDLFELNGKDVLSFSPQGLKKDGDLYNNIYQNGYLIGRMDYEKLEFLPEADFLEFDRGFDFYASQTANHKFDSGYLIAWMGLPDISYPSEKDGWVGSMTMTRELKLVKNRIYQYPVEGYKMLRKNPNITEAKSLKQELGGPREVQLSEIDVPFKLTLFAKEGQAESGFSMVYDGESFVIDRGQMTRAFAIEEGASRRISGLKIEKLNVFIDNSSVEIFINGGEYSLSSRIFPTEEEKLMVFESCKDFEISVWELEPSVDRSFVL